MNIDKKSLGIMGEDIAESYLKKLGYKILERNFKTKYTEIDIVSKEGNILVFVEVRTKTDDILRSPEETIRKNKKWKLKRGASGYIKIKSYSGPCRIDAICLIVFNGKCKRLNHYKNIIS